MSSSNRTLAALLAAALYMGFLARPASIAPQGGLGGPGPLTGLPGDVGGPIEGITGPGQGGTGGKIGGEGSKGRTQVRTGLKCAPGLNGGETDVGVSATRIRLATTAVLDGPAKTLLSGSPTAMAAVINRVNSAGGICGRLLDLKVVNDSFVASDGQRFIENFIEEGYFALPVVPSAEGLSAAIDANVIGRAGIPVVGTDGMRVEQYQEPTVWPVATATVSTLRIMAEYGYRKKGARTFAIVWDGKYKFGVEGANAFKQYVEKELGADVVSDIRLDPDQAAYGPEVNKFNQDCGNNGCDMVALLLLPDTAVKWFTKSPLKGAKYTAGAQTLFSDDFAGRCVQNAGALCDGIAVWTGYVPPIDRLAGLPDIERYVNDVRSLRPGIDTRNQFVQGAYLGMSVFVEALKKVGPDLTRARLREIMDSMTYKTDLAPTLSWSASKHAANTRARSFSIVGAGRFEGWRDEQTGWVVDPAGGP